MGEIGGTFKQWAGIAEWLFREAFPLKAQEMDLLRVRLARSQLDLSHKSIMYGELREENCHLGDALSAATLELATLKNKIVERAQVPSTLKAKTSADVRRIVEQTNEAEFEEQANAPFRS